ncbi:mercuric reductase [Gemmatimonas sp.]|uniref:mercuric reductase n=1 Tax=Gemmatimonas sp. TaxID=1962908 RepID=UPI00286A1E4D|nr:mercuric reductase [Gemmatimonas sp.]
MRLSDSPPPDWPSDMPLLPFDEANAQLMRTVAPKGWIAPVPKDRYHLVVIGAGTAGLVSAAIAAGLGARVALIERHMFGGDCLNFGCVPSKAVIRAARAWRDARTAAGRFGGPQVTNDGDFGAVMARMRGLRAAISPVDGVERFRSLGIDVFLGNAAFTAPDAIAVNDTVLRFRRAIIATGARAARPPIPGLAETPYDTNESIFSLTERPARLIVIGGGPIGAELAQSFARFGSAVTLVHADAHLLPRDDADAAHIVTAALESDGVRMVHRANVERVLHDGQQFSVHLSGDGAPSVLEAERVLVATGRTPNVDGLGLDVAGIRFTPKGVRVDERLRTSNPRVYAIGDVSSALQFTHVADAQARLVVANALFFGIGGGRASALVVPRVTYTDPEVAHVGMTVEEASAQGVRIDTVQVNLEDNDRARLDDEPHGFLKVHVAAGTDRIVGATLVATHAGEMIGEMTVAITNRIGLGAVGKAIHAYPTQAEVFRRAADAWRKRAFTSRAKQFFALWFRVFT